MRKQISSLVIIAVLIGIGLTTTSCGKMRPVRELEQLVDEVDEHGSTYGFSEWVDVFQQYNAINAEIDKNYPDYSTKQRARINQARSEFKSTARDVIWDELDIIPGLKEKLKGMLQALFEKFDSTSPTSEQPQPEE